MVVVQADLQKDSFLAAFDVGTGRELWRTPRNEAPTFSTPAGIGAQIVVNGWKEIAGYDAKTGKRLWQMEGAGDIPVPTPVSAGGLIVLTSAHGGGRPIYALRPDGTQVWSQDRAGNYMQTPLLEGGLGYFCFDNGVLTVFQLRTGERVYQQRLGGGSSGFSSSPVAAAGHLYITNEEGRTYVVALGLRYNLLAENELGETVMATPAIVDGVVYIRGRKHLFAIGAN
jgi:outer membrane protein assembly factor BamB